MSDAEQRSLEGTKDAPVGPRIQLPKAGPAADMSATPPNAPARRKHHRKKDAEGAPAKQPSPLRQDATGAISEAVPASDPASDKASSSSSASSSTSGTPLTPASTVDGATPVVPDAKTPLLAQLPRDVATVRSSSALPVSRTPDSASVGPISKVQQSSSMVCCCLLFSRACLLLVCIFVFCCCESVSFLHQSCMVVSEDYCGATSPLCAHTVVLEHVDMV